MVSIARDGRISKTEHASVAPCAERINELEDRLADMEADRFWIVQMLASLIVDREALP